MRNKKKHQKSCNPLLIYIVAFVISLALTIPFWISSEKVYAIVFESIGCSGISASLIAIFIYMFENNKKREQLSFYRIYYIQPIQREIIGLFKKILWFSENLNLPDMNWSLPNDEYLGLWFLIYTEKYKSKNRYSIEEAIVKAKKFVEDFNLVTDLNEKAKFLKAFQIVESHTKYLLQDIVLLEQNKLLLNQLEIVELDKIENLCRNVSFVQNTFKHESGNKRGGIELLESMFKALSLIHPYKEDVVPSFQGTYMIK